MMQFPIAAQWARRTGRTFDCWLDETTCKPLVNLFKAQPGVDEVKLIGGIENWQCGGQPFHFNLKTSDFAGRTIYHLGFRGFPQRQLTLETAENAKLPIEIDRDALAVEPGLVVEPSNPAHRVVLHGQPVYAHTRNTPTFWKFLSIVSKELEGMFEQRVFVGNARDREVGMRTYPGWSELDDGGDFLDTARLMAGSTFVLACGSSMAALAGALKVPCIRVHDPIGDSPKNLWNSLGENQLNETEVALRKSWPEFRDRWLIPQAVSP